MGNPGRRHGPLAIVSVHVDEYVPGNAPAGIAIAKLSVTSDGPSPVPVFALKIGTAVGAVLPAGIVMGAAYEIVFAGSEQLPASAMTEATPATVVAVDGRVWPPLSVKVVEVTSMFQPLPVPVSSSGVKVNEPELVWLNPFSVMPGNIADVGAVRFRLPPVHTVVNSSTSVCS